jgi:hypothetical protein
VSGIGYKPIKFGSAIKLVPFKIFFFTKHI